MKFPKRARLRAAAVTAAATAAATMAAGCGGSASPGNAAHAAARHAAGTASAPAAPPVPRHGGVDLRVLVVTDGSTGVQAIQQELASEGTPVTVVNLQGSSRPRITSSFLSRAAPGGARGGNFDGIVLPSAAPSGLSGAELAALARYEEEFSVRQVDAFVPPSASVGLNPPSYSGSLNGMRATLTRAAKQDGFGYLRGSFTFAGTTSGPAPYGYVAQPVAGSGFTPLLTVTAPGSSAAGALAGVYTRAHRQQLVLGIGAFYYQTQFRYLLPGIVSWLTRGVRLGYWRNYLTIDFDDMFNADAQWSMKGHCTPGDSACPPGTPPTRPIRMNPPDVAYAVNWQRRQHFTIEFLFNGGSSQRFQVNGTDPLLAAIRPVAGEFWWVNHTLSHADLGCAADYTVTPWRCKTPGGHFIWPSTALINSQIFGNIRWARHNGIPASPHELATGEYSGLRILPQQPMDNPNLVRAMGPDKIKWVALDASREPAMRPVGAALGVPRYPINVGYDVDTVKEEVNEYNWYYTSKADGGSGKCQQLKTTRCIKPLSTPGGWTSYIVPIQVQNVLNKVLQNDPRPFFMHVSNLTGDRLAYPVMDGVLAAYRGIYAASTPVVNQPFWAAGEALQAQQQWARALSAGTVSAWVQGSTVTITGPPGTRVPVTAAGQPTGPGRSPFGSPYAGERSGFLTLGSRPLTLALSSAPFRAGGAG